MEIKDYVSAALRTESHTPEVVYQRFADNPDLQAELNTAVSIFIDAAQRLDKIKKHLFYGKPVEFSASAVLIRFQSCCSSSFSPSNLRFSC